MIDRNNNGNAKSFLSPNTPVVSVCITTYNHEPYIAQALDSVLAQETDFNFEILIGEDDSSDNTRAICIEYAEKYPDKIRLFLNDRKNVIYINGMATGRWNFINNIKNARGKYIALLEGDDYWIDPQKLQKQVSFLEEHEEYNICFHKVQVLFQNNFINDDEIEKRFDKINKPLISSIDLLEQGNFMHTPSVVFRNKIRKLPFEFNYSPVGDYFFHIINSQNGYIKRLEDKMAVYRKGVGIYSTLSPFEMTEKILAYQACILSYLVDNKSKEILLNRHSNTLNNFSNNANKQFTSKDYLVNNLPISTVLSILLLKIKKKLLKWL